MKILVTGSGGQLGSELQDLAKLNPQIAFDFTDYPEVDLTNQDHIKKAVGTKSYDYCINCAAYTAVDKAEEDKSTATALNTDACKYLAEACLENDTILIQISTDFVFDGTAYKPLKEEKEPKPISHYGLTKLQGENVIREKMEKYFIFRTSWLYSTYGANFVKTMIRLSETRDELNIIADQIGTPTYARDLAKEIMNVIISKSEAYGLYHYSNEGVASWYDFTCAIFEYKGIACQVNPIPTEKYPTPAARPNYSVMDKSKIRETFGIKIPHWRTSLKECLEKLG